jgi:hypothetical protein
MTRSGTSLCLNLRRLARIAVWAVLAASGGCAAHGQVSIQPMIDPSPMIARGHLEGGINGEGIPRPDGKTPLMLAVEANDLKVIEYLLQRGADLDLKDADDETALDLARRRMMHEAADLLSAHASEHPGFSVYYAGKSPVLSAISARSQSGAPGCAAAHSLVVSVADRDGKPLADAPVRFAVGGGGKYLLTQASSPDSPSLLLRSDGSGQCRANIHLPKEPNTRIHITASVGAGEQESKVTFTALTNDGTGGDSDSCFDPTGVQASASSAGDLDLSWQNNTDDETAIEIRVKTLKGWKLVATLPPHSTSAHIPAE